ncbi:MAG: glycogen phosphorylase [Epulopiscium sp. Nuni2H_MBin001]|nr:MAG: glycogen phosphorylase [Epulopiscium sp. Nuni2H_MBin001]
MERYAKVKYGRNLKEANNVEMMNCLGLALLEYMVDDWDATEELYNKNKKAYYISAEFLMGRALGNNLIALGIYDPVKEILDELGFDINCVEAAEEDAALGNGGLGRLAACFMDSGAATNIPLQGYGIRYSNGLFKQVMINGAQTEVADEWKSDPFSIRKDYLAVEVEFEGGKVRAVPYDMPIIGYGSYNINTLRLWQSEPIVSFDFGLFNAQRYDEAVREKSRAEDISRVLYPNDSNWEGKVLRLKQQYFLVSASLQDIIRSHKELHGDLEDFHKWHAIQLNDTHPTLAIPEFLRIMIDVEDVQFDEALVIARKVFAYTNHTILQEALEKWDINLIRGIIPRVYEIIEILDTVCVNALSKRQYTQDEIHSYRILRDGKVHMANLAIHIGFAVNGVAALHTKILMDTELANWYKLYPKKFQNKTNGITPRRWIRYCNFGLSTYITELLGTEEWVKDLSLLKQLEKFKEDDAVLTKIMEIKHHNKEILADYVKSHEGIEIDPDSIFDIQVKRLHEYKRQLLNAFYILDLYFRVKRDPELDVPKTTFLFGAKAFPGYARAKAIVKFIGEIAKLVNNDESIKGKIKVVFVENYCVTYAEKLVPACDVSKQISTAGKEASGTGNMKFMLNGAPTFGTYDGANVEIVQESGDENNFIFGLRVEDITELKPKYDPVEIYQKNADVKRVVDSLIDGTFSDGGTGEFKELWTSLVNGTSWQRADRYFLLADFAEFKAMQDKVFEAYKDKRRWAQMCLMNIANAGIFSSDRTILQYADEIWGIKQCSVEK